MLKSTRKYIEDNFDLNCPNQYTYNFGNWVLIICLNLNSIDVFPGRTYNNMLNVIVNKQFNNQEYSYYEYALVKAFERWYKKFNFLKKYRPKRLNINDFTILLKKINIVNSNFEKYIKTLAEKNNIIELKKDFE